MFNFFDEIRKRIYPQGSDFISEYNIVNMSGKILYIEGHCGIKSITTDKIALNLKKDNIEIIGENLKIKEISDKTILIEGEIIKVGKA